MHYVRSEALAFSKQSNKAFDINHMIMLQSIARLDGNRLDIDQKGDCNSLISREFDGNTMTLVSYMSLDIRRCGE